MAELTDVRVRVAASRALSGDKRGIRAMLPFLGPAFIACSQTEATNSRTSPLTS